MSTTPTVPETIIYEALVEHVHSIADTLALPLSLPDRPFDVPVNRKYLRMAHVSQDSERMFIGSDEPARYFGILQVTVVWPPDRGLVESREVAGRVADMVPADHKMVYDGHVVRALRRPVVASSYQDGADVLTPVSIEYESYI